MTLTERLKEKLGKFDQQACGEARFEASIPSKRIDIAFEQGARWENSRLAPILARLVDCVAALESLKARWEAVGAGKTTSHEIVEQTLAALKKELGE